ncbi:MAG: cysteine--tRNA ligase [Candidatus Omnitrophica bacterium]|nr:cysteine--tRNA ligase [Candidatus Omnitrophota bacterium]
MMISIYNTLTRKKEELRPIEEGRIRMYVCGPTVYDVPHIGHARSAYVFDVIRRYLRHAGYDVCFVRNVTDIDDKIIGKAVAELEELGEKVIPSRLEKRVREVAEKYLDIYHKELEVLGIEPPTEEPRATENIEEMIQFIRVLIEKDKAYVSKGNVYFSVEKYTGYGKLSNRDLEQMTQGTRVAVDDSKAHPLDFALWKSVKEGEPYWESPWGPGRPGWHIECSVMSTGILGPSFDIHGGGLDLIFPHHENEIAQAEAGTGQPFANYWMHNGLLTVNGEKMSKSLGNFITIPDHLEKYPDPDLIKLAFLTSHYRSPMDHSEKKMREMGKVKERIMIFIERAERAAPAAGDVDVDAELLLRAQDASAAFQEKFERAMRDDFNTPEVISAIFEAVKWGNERLADDSLIPVAKAALTLPLKNSILKLADVLGLSLRRVKVDELEADRIERLVRQREAARGEKDYARADRIRDELIEIGIIIEDTPEGPVWRQK